MTENSTEVHEEECDEFKNTNLELKAMRKSLRSRSVCASGATPGSTPPTYSLYAGLKVLILKIFRLILEQFEIIFVKY